MIYVAPSAAYEAVAHAPTGLTGTIAVRVIDNDGATTTARTISGIAEYPAGSGIYQAQLTAPADGGQYTIVWDTGTTTPTTVATEELVVTYTAPGTSTGTLYVTRTALKGTLTLANETFADDDIDLALEAASRAIDEHCGRRFYPDSDAAQVRYFSALEDGIVRVDDLVTLTTLKTDPDRDGVFEYTWAATDYALGPVNALAEGRPYTEIQRLPYGSYYFPTYYPATIQVTGKFGWAAAPPAVKAATSILATRLLKRMREAPLGVVGFGMDGATVRVSSTDPDVGMLLAPFVRKVLLV